MNLTLRYRNPLMILLLTFVTCGLYFFYLVYDVSEQLKPYNYNDSMASGMEVFLCIICSPYIVYWFYKYAKVVYEMQKSQGLSSPDDNSIICLIISLFCFPVIAMMIIQSSINKSIQMTV